MHPLLYKPLLVDTRWMLALGVDICTMPSIGAGLPHSSPLTVKNQRAQTADDPLILRSPFHVRRKAVVEDALLNSQSCMWEDR